MKLKIKIVVLYNSQTHYAQFFIFIIHGERARAFESFDVCECGATCCATALV